MPGVAPLPPSFIEYAEHRSRVLEQRLAECNLVITPPLETANVKKFYLAAMAAKPFTASVAAAGRTFIVPRSDARVRTLEQWFKDARSAAEVLAAGIVHREGPAAGVLMVHARDRGKDPVACLNRRYSNTLERRVVDMGMASLCSEFDAPGSSLMPHDEMPMRLLDTEHDGFSYLRWFVGSPNLGEMRGTAERQLFDATHCVFSVEVAEISTASFAQSLDSWLGEKGLPQIASMQPSRVPLGLIGSRAKNSRGLGWFFYPVSIWSHPILCLSPVCLILSSTRYLQTQGSSCADWST